MTISPIYLKVDDCYLDGVTRFRNAINYMNTSFMELVHLHPNFREECKNIVSFNHDFIKKMVSVDSLTHKESFDMINKYFTDESFNLTKKLEDLSKEIQTSFDDFYNSKESPTHETFKEKYFSEYPDKFDKMKNFLDNLKDLDKPNQSSAFDDFIDSRIDPLFKKGRDFYDDDNDDDDDYEEDDRKDRKCYGNTFPNIPSDVQTAVLHYLTFTGVLTAINNIIKFPEQKENFAKKAEEQKEKIKKEEQEEEQQKINEMEAEKQKREEEKMEMERRKLMEMKPEKLKAEIERLTNEKEELTKEVTKLTKDKEELEDIINELKKNKDSLSDEIEKLRPNAKIIEEEKSEESLASEKEKDELQKQTEDSTVEQKDKEIQELKDMIKSLQEKNQTLQTENQTLKEKNQTLQTENQTLQTENQTLKEKNQTLQTENQSEAQKNKVIIHKLLEHNSIIKTQYGNLKQLMGINTPKSK